MGLLLLMAGGSVPVLALADNLIPDGKLEQAPTGDTLPAEVSTSVEKVPDTPTPTVSLSTVVPPGVAHTICIQRSGFRGFARARLCEPIAVQADHRYYFCCLTKWTDGTAGMLFNFLDAQHRGQSGFQWRDAQSTVPGMNVNHNIVTIAWGLAAVPNDFNRLDVTFTVPAGAAYVNIDLDYGTSSGTAWYGDFQLLPLD